MLRLVIALPALLLLTLACGKDRFEITAISATSPVEPNERVRLVASTSRGAVCTVRLGEIKRTDKSDPPRTLPPRSSDSDGSVTFVFGVPRDAVAQDLSVTLSCTRKGETAEASASVEVNTAELPFPAETATPVETPAG